MNQTSNTTHTSSNYGAYGAFDTLTMFPPGEAEYRASSDILRMLDTYGPLTRQQIAHSLGNHGVCMLRDVLEGMRDMRLIEEVAGGVIQRVELKPLPIPARHRADTGSLNQSTGQPEAEGYFV